MIVSFKRCQVPIALEYFIFTFDGIHIKTDEKTIINKILTNYEFGFLNVYIFLKKKSFIDKSFLFLVKKNIGEEPELGLKKYIPSNIKLKYSKTTSSWHTLCLMMNTLKSLSFKKTQTLITKGKICFIWMILISGTFLIWILVTCIFIRPCFFF